MTSGFGVSLSKQGTSHKLTIQSCSDADSGLYRFVAGEHDTQGKMVVGGTPSSSFTTRTRWCIITLRYTLCFPDVPEFDPDDLHKFSKPVTVRTGQNAAFKMPFRPHDSLVVSWFKDGAGMKDGGGVKIVREPSHSRLLIRDCLRTDTGEIKLQLQNPFGAVEATTQLTVLGPK